MLSYRSHPVTNEQPCLSPSEMMKAGLIGEMVGDAMDDAMDSEDLEEESEEQVQQILAEIAIDTKSSMPSAKAAPRKTKVTAAEEEAEEEEDDEMKAMRERLAAVRA